MVARKSTPKARNHSTTPIRETPDSRLCSIPDTRPTTEGISEVELLSLRSEADAAEFLCASPRTLQTWRLQGGGPRYVKNGRSVRYRLKDLIAYSEAHLRAHTSG